MVLMKIYRVFEQRRNKINKMLNNGYSKAKKSELLGAKNEIETFLKTIEYYYKEQSKQIQKEPELTRKLKKDDFKLL